MYKNNYPKPVVTIYCTFTREWAVDRWLVNLSQLDYPKKLINLVCIVDIDSPWIASRLSRVQEQYGGFFIQINKDHQPNEVRPVERRKRIAYLKEEYKSTIDMFDSDFVLGLEDDTVFENLNLEKFIGFMEKDPFIGFVEGVQCGRWHYKMIGAWKFDDIDNPTEAFTLLPKTGYEEIDAGGFYGYLIKTENYLAIPYDYSGEAWGPDVNAGLWLRRAGFKNYIDWDTKFGHNDHNQILWPDTDIKQYKVKFFKEKETWLPIQP